jgi:Fe-S cluster assembly iron-binding protein IscA
MLLVTEAAAEVVKTLTATPQAPEGTGLRIASTTPVPSSPEALQLSAATGPVENDEVIEAAGAHFYLEPQVVTYLEDKVLDAQVDSEGHATFSLGMQGRDQA